MHRFYVPPEEITGGEVWLGEDEARHARDVLRMRVDDEAEALDGEGRIYPARVVCADKAGVCLHLGGGRADELEHKVRVTLYQAVPKAGKMELIIQKCTELGVFAVVPVLTARCVVKLGEREAAAKQTRWQRVALEAAKQCGRSRIPKVYAPMPLDNAQAMYLGHELALLPWEEARDAPLKPVLQSGGLDIGVLIGPEGGLEAREALALEKGGAAVVTLGKRILRTETAGMALMAIINYETGVMG